jgi:integrase
MARTGMEWAAVAGLTARDVNLDTRTLHARGTKNEWRDREVVCMEDWAWEIFAPYARRFIGSASLFGTVAHQTALHTHHRAHTTAEVPQSTLHDWRHTFGLLQRRKGVLDSVIAHQLGHRDTRLVAQRYGGFKVQPTDYHQQLVQSVSGWENRASRYPFATLATEYARSVV